MTAVDMVKCYIVFLIYVSPNSLYMYAVSNSCVVQTTLSLCNQNVTFPKHLFNSSDIYYAKLLTMYIYI